MTNQDGKILQIELTSSPLFTIYPSYLILDYFIGLYTGRGSLDLGTDIPVGIPLSI